MNWGHRALLAGTYGIGGGAIWTGHTIRRLARFDCAIELLPRDMGDHRGSNVLNMRNRRGDSRGRLELIIYFLGSAGAQRFPKVTNTSSVGCTGVYPLLVPGTQSHRHRLRNVGHGRLGGRLWHPSVVGWCVNATAKFSGYGVNETRVCGVGELRNLASDSLFPLGRTRG